LKLCGIDYSLSCPAITVFEGNTFSSDNCKTYFLTDVKKYINDYGDISGSQIKTYSSPIERYENIALWAMSFIKGADYAAIEDYSMGSRGRVFHIAENTAILKYLLTKEGVPYKTYPPTVIKKFAIKGNADKSMMYSAYLKDTKRDLRTLLSYTSKNIASPISDISDSYFIAKYLYKDLLETPK
jgi:hypothetical protein